MRNDVGGVGDNDGSDYEVVVTMRGDDDNLPMMFRAGPLTNSHKLVPTRGQLVCPVPAVIYYSSLTHPPGSSTGTQLE